MPRNSSPIGLRVIEPMTNSTAPTGGVNDPIIRLRIMMTPSCTGSIPYWAMIGIRIGTSTRITGGASRKMPSRISSTFSSSRKTIGLEVRPASHSPRLRETCSRASTSPMRFDAPRISRMPPEMTTVSLAAFQNTCQFRVR